MKPDSTQKQYRCLHCQHQFCADKIANAHTYLVNPQNSVFESIDDANGKEQCQVCDRSWRTTSFSQSLLSYANGIKNRFIRSFHRFEKPIKHQVSH